MWALLFNLSAHLFISTFLLLLNCKNLIAFLHYTHKNTNAFNTFDVRKIDFNIIDEMKESPFHKSCVGVSLCVCVSARKFLHNMCVCPFFCVPIGTRVTLMNFILDLLHQLKSIHLNNIILLTCFPCIHDMTAWLP